MSTDRSGVPVLGCTDCRYLFTPSPAQWADLAATGCPRCQGWTWLAALAHPSSPNSTAASAGRGACEEHTHV